MNFFVKPEASNDFELTQVDTATAEQTAFDAQKIYRDLIERRPALLDEKLKLHTLIIDEFNLASLEKLPRHELTREIKTFVADYTRAERISLNQKELELFSAEIVDEMIGFGPIEPLLKDPTVNDILINTHKNCFVERFGKLERTKVHFKDEAHLLRIINRIVAGIGRRVDELSPMVDARLPDGSRVNIAIKPASVDGPLVSIRKFSERPFSMDRLIEIGSVRAQMVDTLRAAVQGKISILISGGTGSGKTTILNALSSYIPADERLITIEDAAELQLQQPHVGRLETRPANAEGKGEIRQRDLVKNALRMRPDRIIIGECRGEEAFDMLQAMNTGHEGSMTTIHANTPRDALKRLEQMVAMAGVSMSSENIRSQIASSINLVVQLQRLTDGKRRVTSISEITGMEGDVIQLCEIYKFVKDRSDDSGIHGTYRATGVRPTFLLQLKALGIELPFSHFDFLRAALEGYKLSELWIIFVVIFCAAVLAVQGAYWLFVEGRRTTRAINRRLVLSTQGVNSQRVLEALKRERGFTGFESHRFSYWNDLLTQTGMRLDGKVMAISALSLSALFFAGLGLAIGYGLVALLAAPVLAILSMVLFFGFVRRKRIRRFSEQLPDAIDVIVRGIKSGYPFIVALGLVAKEMPDPIGTEFGMTSDEINFGLGINAALDNLYRRVGQEDLLFFTMATKIQNETGGSLAEVLSRLARLLRLRTKLALKVRAITAEGRLSALFLSAMPFLVVAIVSLISPGYYGEILGHPFIMPAVIIGFVMLSVGNVIMYRMVNFKV